MVKTVESILKGLDKDIRSFEGVIRGRRRK